METDNWYLRKLLEDVPPDEIDAACFDEHDLHLDAGEEEAESEGEGESEDMDYEPVLDDSDVELSEEEESEDSEEWEDDLGGEADSGTGDATDDSEEDAQVLGSTEGQ